MQAHFATHKGKVYFVEDNILPTHREANSIIRILEKYKKSHTPKSIKKHNDDAFDAMMRCDPISKIRIKKEGYIYLIKSDKYYKIGRAKSIKDRMRAYRTENPKETSILIQEKVDDYIGIEAELLKMFAHKNHRGEWFFLNKKDVELIKKYLDEKNNSILS